MSKDLEGGRPLVLKRQKKSVWLEHQECVGVRDELEVAEKGQGQTVLGAGGYGMYYQEFGFFSEFSWKLPKGYEQRTWCLYNIT